MPSQLPQRAQVVVVGGGVMGTSAAFHLAEAGADVLLLERGQLGGGSTSKAAGGVRAQFSDALNVQLGARGLEAFAAFGVRPGQDIDLHRTGYLFLLTGPDDVRAFTDAVALQNRLGVPTRLLDAAEAARFAPGLRTDDVLAATFHAGDGYCAPESVVLGYARGARRLGATVLPGVEVVGLDPRAGGTTWVATTAGRVETGAVVCAAGAWSPQIGTMAGVDLPVTPLRRQILVTEPLPDDVAAALPASMPMTIDAATTFYLHREGPGVLLGMSWAGEEPGYRMDVDEAWLPDLAAALERRAPILLDVGIASRWAGLYEDTPDHNALLGEADPAGGGRFLYATGFSGHGFLQGPAVGEILRDLYLGRTPFVDVGPLSADRFARGAPRPERAIV
jgi:sarcosine oxidase subunit beta